MRRILLVPLLVTGIFLISALKIWGFYGHKKITQLAIYTLPEGIAPFYKANASIIVEKSVAPDQRRYVFEAEGPRHYIDLDDYDNPDSIPRYWSDAVSKYGEEFLNQHGLGPWYTYFTYRKLIDAMASDNSDQILRLSCDLAHYIADANVPLHTTSNYNGQKSGQDGIHGFWETRLPQLFSDDYDFLVGQASYVENPQRAIWDAVLDAHALVDSVFIVEQEVTEKIGRTKKYAFEDKGRRTVKVYSERFSSAYHDAFPVVEQQMRRSVKMIGDFWFTAWIEAGQPNLNRLNTQEYKSDSTEVQKKIKPARLHEF